MLTKTQKTEREQQIAKMREWLKPGDTVYTVLDHVSRSGMSRNIRVILMKTDDKSEPYTLHPNYAVSLICGYRRAKHGDGFVVGGCGMDMGFEVVYNLGRVLFPDGFKVEGRGRNGDTSGWDNDGGYALKHKWL